MSEKKVRTVGDKDAGERYKYVVETGRLLFENSGLVDRNRKITREDLSLIDQYHQAVSPVNPSNPWRVVPVQRSISKGEIVDASIYGNWDAFGGPLEHIHLATKAAEIIVTEIHKHLKNPDELRTPCERFTWEEVRKVDPLHAAASAGLHDEGREITHIFFTNEVIGNRLLKGIGVREDIIAVLPSESVMLTPEDESMDEVIRGLNPEAVILRIADEFGKRVPGRNRLFQLTDYDEGNQEAWAQRYISRPFSGRPSDKMMRENIGLHNKNAQRYCQV